MKASTDSGDERRVHLTIEVCRVNLLRKQLALFNYVQKATTQILLRKGIVAAYCSLFAFVDFFENFIIV